MTLVNSPSETEDMNLRSSQLSMRAWEQIFECAKCQTYKKNETILKQGELIRKIYQIADGNCRVELPGKTLIHKFYNFQDNFINIFYYFHLKKKLKYFIY